MLSIIQDPELLVREMPDTHLREPVWKRRDRRWGGPRQLHQMETLMAALNIHCCRWVWVWINSLINECKLRTKQPEGNKGTCSHWSTSTAVLGGSCGCLQSWPKLLLLSSVLIRNKLSKWYFCLFFFVFLRCSRVKEMIFYRKNKLDTLISHHI